MPHQLRVTKTCFPEVPIKNVSLQMLGQCLIFKLGKIFRYKSVMLLLALNIDWIIVLLIVYPIIGKMNVKYK